MTLVGLRQAFFGFGIEGIAQPVDAVAGERIEHGLGEGVGREERQTLRRPLLDLRDQALIGSGGVSIDELDIAPLWQRARSLPRQDIDEIVFGGPVEMRGFRPHVVDLQHYFSLQRPLYAENPLLAYPTPCL